jgi:calcium-dependent protein kinase
VKLGNYLNNPDKKVAIKIIEKKKLKDKIHMLMREVEIIKSLDHPNIIKFYEAYHDNMWFYIVMEYCSGGELLDHLTQKKFLREKEASEIMYKLFSAVNHMHLQGIVHRDLKLDNILYQNDEK